MLERDSPRVLREISSLVKMGIWVITLEPFTIYFGSGDRKVFLRKSSSNIPEKVQRRFSAFFTFPAAEWLSSKSILKRITFMLAQPILLIFNSLVMFHNALTAIKSERPSFIIVHNAPDINALLARICSIIFRIPYVYECRDPAPVLYSELVKPVSVKLAKMAEFLLEPIEAVSARNAAVVITVGNSMANRLIRKYGLRNCFVIYGGPP